jgi:hypothetical protein
LDLSEQEIIDCSDSYPHRADQAFNIGTVFNYIKNHGVCYETDYPLNICYDYPVTNTCLSGSFVASDLVKINGYNNVASSPDDIKRAIMVKGPMLSGWYKTNDNNNHIMVLVGYGTIHLGDTISFYNYTTNTAEPITVIDTLYANKIGETYWIFKNSWGTGITGQSYDGYMNLLFTEVEENGNVQLQGMMTPRYFTLPVISQNYSDIDIAIVDEDGDGYYNWGLSQTKPASCPVWIPSQPDGDDTDPTKHLMDSYGNFPEIYTYPVNTDIIYNNQTVSYNAQFTDDIKLYHGVTLTITGSAYCLENVKIDNTEGILIVDGGVLANANILMGSQGKLKIRNGGSIYMKKGLDFEVPVGCELEIDEGQIRGPYERKF